MHSSQAPKIKHSMDMFCKPGVRDAGPGVSLIQLNSATCLHVFRVKETLIGKQGATKGQWGAMNGSGTLKTQSLETHLHLRPCPLNAHKHPETLARQVCGR